MSIKKIKNEPFFFFFGLLMLTTVAGAFGSHALVNPEDLPPFTPLIILHGIIMLCWFTLFIFQAGMIRARNISMHKRMGTMSMVLATGLLITGLLVTLSGYERSGDAMISMANFTSMLTFLVLYVFALLKRDRPAIHKRLLLIASIRMLAPAFVRICLVVNINIVFTPLLVLLFLSGLVVYDILRLKRLHASTILGIILVIISLALVPSFGTSSAWTNILDSLVE